MGTRGARLPSARQIVVLWKPVLLHRAGPDRYSPSVDRARWRVASFDGAQPAGAEGGLASLVATHAGRQTAKRVIPKADVQRHL